MLTVGRMARRFGPSRSTLLYYDSIGLLSPSGRSASNYRLYSDDDVRRLELVHLYRAAGLPLADIGRVLSADRTVLRDRLESRLQVLDGEIAKLRQQQHLLAQLLRGKLALRRTRTMDKATWVSILRASGMSEDDMQRWHVEFERVAPEAHRDFLESLGLRAPEVGRIREWSRAARLREPAQGPSSSSSRPRARTSRAARRRGSRR